MKTTQMDITVVAYDYSEPIYGICVGDSLRHVLRRLRQAAHEPAARAGVDGVCVTLSLSDGTELRVGPERASERGSWLVGVYSAERVHPRTDAIVRRYAL